MNMTEILIFKFWTYSHIKVCHLIFFLMLVGRLQNIYLFFGNVQKLMLVIVNFSVMFNKFRPFSFGHINSVM